MANAREWLAGTRPRTLPAAIVPVLIGSGVAIGYGKFSPWKAALTLLVALALQVGVNYANDYSDGVRGTDAAGKRVGPVRLVGWGLAKPGHVKAAAFACFGVACLAGLALAAVTSWWLVLAGALCVAAAWFYTGGSRPYGYLGFGEVSVFVFFGIAAVAGTAYVQMGTVSWLGLLAAIPAGLLSCALLMVNNLRDIPSDREAGKLTLAVRIGDARSRAVYLAFVLVPFVLAACLFSVRPWALLMLLALPLAIVPLRSVRGGASGRALITTLGQTGRLQMAFGLAFTVGLALHRLSTDRFPAGFLAGFRSGAPLPSHPPRVGGTCSGNCTDARWRPGRHDNLPLNPWFGSQMTIAGSLSPRATPTGPDC